MAIDEHGRFYYGLTGKELPFLVNSTRRRTHYIPFYSDYADYNTNAKSYYDYLARFNRGLAELAEFANMLAERVDDLEDRMDKVEDRLDEVEEAIDNLEDRMDEAEDRIRELEEGNEALENALQKIIDNLFESGAIDSNNLDGFNFNDGRNIATGNINVFTNEPDGNTFIRTNNGQTEYDIAGGIE